ADPPDDTTPPYELTADRRHHTLSASRREPCTIDADTWRRRLSTDQAEREELQRSHRHRRRLSDSPREGEVAAPLFARSRSSPDSVPDQLASATWRRAVWIWSRAKATASAGSMAAPVATQRSNEAGPSTEHRWSTTRFRSMTMVLMPWRVL